MAKTARTSRPAKTSLGAKGASGAKGAYRATKSKVVSSKPAITAKVRRTSSQAYGSREEWDTIRRKVLSRDGYRCTKCPATTDLTVDHIIAIAQGGRTVMSNLRTLCVPCHCRLPRHKKVTKLLKAGAQYRKNNRKKKKGLL